MCVTSSLAIETSGSSFSAPVILCNTVISPIVTEDTSPDITASWLSHNVFAD